LGHMGSKNADRWTQAEEWKETVTDWLNGLAGQAYAASGQMSELNGDDVEKTIRYIY
jgi:hypothetical protein